MITDPWHPVTAPTVSSLRRGCTACRIVAVSEQQSASADDLPPPGVERVVPVPPAEDGDFVDEVLTAAVAHAVTAVLPWTDRDARALAPHSDRFLRAGAPLVCPAADLVELATDKWATMTRLREFGIPVPATRRVRTGDQLREAADELGYPRRSLVLKPRQLAGGVGVWRIASDADPMVRGALPGLPLTAMVAALDESIAGPARDLVVQHHVDGMDTSVDALAHHGCLLGAVGRSREATLGGLSVAGRVRRPSGITWDAVERVASELNWSGLMNVQLIADRDGRPVVYEINARAAGSIALASHAGVDLLAAAIQLARTGRPPDGLLREPAPGQRDGDGRRVGGLDPRPTSFRRYWFDQSWPTPTARTTQESR